MEQKFNYNNLPVRTTTDVEDQIWFAGIDICNILEYAKPTQAIEKLDDDEKKLDLVREGSGQMRRAWMLNLSGFFSLALTSTKPEAKAFKRWVTHDVLPAIQKAGKYSTEQEKEHELKLQSLILNIESLEGKKEECQKKINDLRKEIENSYGEMRALIKSDRSQLPIPFVD